MAKRIGVLEADAPLTAEPCDFVSKNVARYLVRHLLARRIGPMVIQMVKVAVAVAKQAISQFWDGPLGIGNLVPFAKPNNYGDKLHYEMPMANDIGLRRHGLYRRISEDGKSELLRHKIKVSARSRAFHLESACVRNLASGLLAG
jgi:hypothetical protein